MDNIIEAKELQIERKHFYVELRENDRGKFLRLRSLRAGTAYRASTGIDELRRSLLKFLPTAKPRQQLLNCHFVCRAAARLHAHNPQATPASWDLRLSSAKAH
jgi:hypothetical protein